MLICAVQPVSVIAGMDLSSFAAKSAGFDCCQNEQESATDHLKSEWVDGVSPAAQNMAIETFLGVMVLLLAMFLIAIVLAPTVTGTMATSARGPGADDAPLRWPADEADAAPGAAPPRPPDAVSQELGSQPRPHPQPQTQAQTQPRRGRYQARHTRGYAAPPPPQQRPPWEEARTPPDAR